MEIRLGPPVSSSEPRFMVDAMLGGLARWLRILGCDAAYDPHISHDELVKQVLEEKRLGLATRSWLISRCTVRNHPLQLLAEEKAAPP